MYDCAGLFGIILFVIWIVLVCRVVIKNWIEGIVEKILEEKKKR